MSKIKPLALRTWLNSPTANANSFVYARVHRGGFDFNLGDCNRMVRLHGWSEKKSDWSKHIMKMKKIKQAVDTAIEKMEEYKEDATTQGEDDFIM